MVSHHALRVPLNADASMAVLPSSPGRKRDMIELLSDENNPSRDTEYIANAKGTELNSNGVRNFNDTSLQEIDDNGGVRKRQRNLPNRYRE
jgi:hypothetical protein